MADKGDKGAAAKNADDDHKDNEPLAHEGWSSLRDKKRRCCTDFIFLVCNQLESDDHISF